MIDFDELDGLEEERHRQEAPLRAAAERAAVLAEEALHFTAHVCTCPDRYESAVSLVPLYTTPSCDGRCCGERYVGDVLRLVREKDGWALLHPLELDRPASDYQDYWHAILKDEVPRLHNEAWISCSYIERVEVRLPVRVTDPSQWLPAPRLETGMDKLPAADSAQDGMISQKALDLVSESLTIIISTSPSQQHCDANMLLKVLESLEANAALRPCRKLIVFDALPNLGESHAARAQGVLAESGERWVPHANEQLAQRYAAYHKAVAEVVRQMHPTTELLEMHAWGHLVGTVTHAMEVVATPFVLLHQHDLLIAETLTPRHVVGILHALAEQRANYVLLNRDVNLAGRSTQYFQAAPHSPELWRHFVHCRAQCLDDGTPLMPFVGYSDQTHFARADWVRGRVLPLVGKKKCCMEFVLHELMILGWLHEPMSWERTYMLGGMSDGPFIYDLQKNGTCWAHVEDAYSTEKEDELFVVLSDRVPHPSRQHTYLSLYAYHPGLGSGQDGIAHFPDAEAHRNRLSRDRFAPQSEEFIERPPV